MYYYRHMNYILGSYYNKLYIYIYINFIKYYSISKSILFSVYDFE